MPRFYFNKLRGRCELFSYGGCGGNTNNFAQQDECVAHCGGPLDEVLHAVVSGGYRRIIAECCCILIKNL